MRRGLSKSVAALLTCLFATAVVVATAAGAVAGPTSRPPAVSVANASGAQDAGSIVFTVRLSHRTSKRVTVRYATTDGSATAGSDYSTVRGRLVFGSRTRGPERMLGKGPDDSVEPGFAGAGDCVFAGACNEHRVWTKVVGGEEAPLTGKGAIAAFSEVTG